MGAAARLQAEVIAGLFQARTTEGEMTDRQVVVISHELVVARGGAAGALSRFVQLLQSLAQMEGGEALQGWIFVLPEASQATEESLAPIVRAIQEHGHARMYALPSNPSFRSLKPGLDKAGLREGEQYAYEFVSGDVLVQELTALTQQILRDIGGARSEMEELTDKILSVVGTAGAA